MAMSKPKPDQKPSEMEMLLPFHAARSLDARDARRVDEALARDPALARQYALIREEYAQTIQLNEGLGAPSARAMQKLFAAIEAEPPRKASVSRNPFAQLGAFLASLSPRTLAWSASLGALALLVQASVIGAVLIEHRTPTFQMGSLSSSPPATRGSGAVVSPRALVRFAPAAGASEVAAMLDSYHATMVEGGGGGMFRLQFDRPMTNDEAAGLMSRLQREKVVSLAVVAAP
jgi:hypothetical protein